MVGLRVGMRLQFFQGVAHLPPSLHLEGLLHQGFPSLMPFPLDEAFLVYIYKDEKYEEICDCPKML